MLLNRPVRTGFVATGFGLASIVIVAALDGYLPLPSVLAVSLLAVAATTYLRQPVWRTAGLLVLSANLALDLVVVYAMAVAGLRHQHRAATLAVAGARRASGCRAGSLGRCSPS